MTQYLVAMIEPQGPPPSMDVLGPIMEEMGRLVGELQAAGQWVFSGGLHDPSTATVLRPEGDDVLITDGPYTEAKEHLGGFTIIEVDDLDAALAWGKQFARGAGLPVEVRPFRDR